jgi:hypothetical protein
LREKGFHQRAVIFEGGQVTQIFRRYLTADHVPFQASFVVDGFASRAIGRSSIVRP